MLAYMLGHRPDEFGLVPDIEGFIPFKELLQAMHEEEGWRYIRRSHINEVLLGKDRSLFESGDYGIRSVDQRWELDLHTPARFLPKILFTAVKRKAHPVVMERGLTGTGEKPLVLSPVRDMALRVGRRRDQKPGSAGDPGRGGKRKADLFLFVRGSISDPRDSAPVYCRAAST